jgi:VAD1 Analog of StAR-related lipid transfer domain
VLPDNGHYRREITYEIQNSKRHFEVADYQVIDVINDHLCYVITERKTAWFLPKSNYFTLVLKVVITHVAKSQCKLTIFCRVEWYKNPLFGKRLIDHQANYNLQSYAVSLADIISDQASRLGVQGGTSARKAINIFGSIGQQNQAVQLLASELAPADLKGRKRIRYRSLLRLIFYASRRMTITYCFVFLAWVVQIIHWSIKTFTAHRFLVLGLAISAFVNFYLSQKEGWTWWQDRRARTYMSQLGVKPNSIMGRSIWIRDLDNFTMSLEESDIGVGRETYGACGSAFDALLSQLNPSSLPTQSSSPDQTMLERISRNRRAYGEYRHDLLVGLRLIGRMERDMLRAEWEQWVWKENLRCKMAEKLIQKSGSKTNNGTEALRKWWPGHCESCSGISDQIRKGGVKL